MQRRYLLVGNPSARSGKAQAIIDQALEAMGRRAMAVEFLATAPAGGTTGLVREALDSTHVDVVVYLGGDGTFADVAKGILSAASLRPLGMMPMGTANDQGKSFGLRPGPEGLEEHLDVIAAGHVVDLDVGKIERVGDADAPENPDPDEEVDADDAPVTATNLFFDSCGWGFQADILASRNRDRESVAKVPLLRELYRDEGVFAGALLKHYLASFLQATKFSASIDSDGQLHQYHGLLDLVIKGTAVYAGSWILDRWAEPDDGLFELVPFAGRRDLFSKLIRDLMSVPLWQEHLSPLGVEHSEGYSAAAFDIRLSRSGRDVVDSQVDGDEWLPGRRFRVTVLRNLLPLIVPADFEPPWRPSPEEDSA